MRRNEQTLEFNSLMFNSLVTHNKVWKNLNVHSNYNAKLLTVSMMKAYKQYATALSEVIRARALNAVRGSYCILKLFFN